MKKLRDPETPRCYHYGLILTTILSVLLLAVAGCSDSGGGGNDKDDSSVELTTTRDDKGVWNRIELYISEHTGAEFSHGMCNDCLKKMYPDFADEIIKEIETPTQ